jgi:hypothetical protein
VPLTTSSAVSPSEARALSPAWPTAFQLFQAGKTTEALEIAGEVSKAEWGMGKGGIMGTKVG